MLYDTIQGGQGNDTLEGNRGVDRLFAQDGNDSLSGGESRDLLYGGKGDDTLNGGQGHDIFLGGEGSDLFDFADGDEAWREQIIDFNPAEDKVLLGFEGPGIDDLILSQDDSNMIINYGRGSLYLENVSEEDLNEDNLPFIL